MRTRIPGSDVIAGLIALSLLIGSCAPYGKGFEPVLDRLAGGDPQAALEELDRKPKEDDALFLLERGLLLRLSGRYRESCLDFDRAEEIAEDLYTRSLSLEGASLLTTDRLLPYRPTPHERLLARYYCFLNYIGLDDLDAALVEARRIGQLLQDWHDAGQMKSLAFVLPLARLAAAVAFEAAGDLDEALLHYRLFEELDQPMALREETTSWIAARKDRLASREAALWNDGPAGDGRSEIGPGPLEIVVFFESGFVPPRSEMRIRVPILKEEQGRGADWAGPTLGRRSVEIYDGHWVQPANVEISYWLEVALPAYVERDPLVSSTGEAGVPGTWGSLHRVGDLAGAAKDALAEQMPGIAIRTAARAFLKFEAHKLAEKEGGKLGGFLANVAGIATEQAETRTWLTLPREIAMTALDVPAPVYEVELRWTDPGGSERSERIPVRWPTGSSIGVVSFRTWR